MSSHHAHKQAAHPTDHPTSTSIGREGSMTDSPLVSPAPAAQVKTRAPASMKWTDWRGAGDPHESDDDGHSDADPICARSPCAPPCNANSSTSSPRVGYIGELFAKLEGCDIRVISNDDCHSWPSSTSIHARAPQSSGTNSSEVCSTIPILDLKSPTLLESV